jgi:type II secretory pathway pseudopilin PulG
MKMKRETRNMSFETRNINHEAQNMKRETVGVAGHSSDVLLGCSVMDQTHGKLSETLPEQNRFAFRVSRFAFLPARAFTLVEVLLAVFILGIGLIMVACVFPVAADWTRQNTEETVAQMVAETGRGIILAKYGYADVSTVTTTVQLLNLAKLPIGERAYALGQSPAYPAASPTTASYYWLPFIRKDPDTPVVGTRYRYDLYIMVFKKGDAVQTYSTAVSPLNADGATVPVACQTAAIGTIPVGSPAIGVTSGTIFRALPGGATSVPVMAENFIYGPPADGTTPSPLVYIYACKANF